MKGQFVRKLISLITILVLAIIITTPAYSLDLEKQRDLIEAYLFVTGQSKEIPALALGDDGELTLPLKCGTPIVADFHQHFDELDKELLSSFGLQNRPPRPVLQSEETFGSPDGLFLIHYTTVGDDSVYQSSVDVDLNDVPDYVDAVADICDSVYNQMINVMGYPVPPVDGFYPDGGDDRYDVYLKNLGGAVYGQTFVDSIFSSGSGPLIATSFMELDKDYKYIGLYNANPLNAVRVTAAHEYFHAVQFGMDVTETEYNPREDFAARYWMEMSAVWMEEQIYDDIDDYIWYLPYYFNDPRSSIQQFRSYYDVHPYASAILPMFLSEKYGQDIIRDIWTRCAETGGSDFLASAHLAIEEISDTTENWASAFAEFGVWNYFTGDRAAYAPPGYGYEERINFPAFHDTMMSSHSNFSRPISVNPDDNLLKPRHNAAQYVRFLTPRLFVDSIYYKCERFVCYESTEVNGFDDWDMRYLDTATCERTWWVCDNDSGTSCMDSVIVPDPDSSYDYVEVDSLFDIWPILGDGKCFGKPTFPLPWGVSFIFQWKENPEEYSVVTLPAPDDSASNFFIPFPDSFQSITTVFTPATYIESYHEYNNPLYEMTLGYFVEKNRGEPDSAFANLPNAFLKPYPNPAVVKEMGEQKLWFQFQVETDSLGSPLPNLQNPHIVVDIFTIAGERVATVTDGVAEDVSIGLYKISWDLENDSDEPVASGIYMAYARMFTDAKKDYQLAEAHTKVAIIR